MLRHLAPRFASLSRRTSSVILGGVLLLTVIAMAFAPRPVAAQTSSGFAGATIFSASGVAATVFFGGSVDQLEAAARAAGATGVWAQDTDGRFELLVVGGPSFLRETFVTRFPRGFPSSVAVMLTRPPGTTTPPPIVTSTPVPAGTATPTPTASSPRPVPTGIPGPSSNE